MSFEAVVEIPPEPRVIGAARRMVRSYLDRWEVPVDQDVALLLVSELVTNAVRHTEPPLELRLRWDPPVLRASVRDGSVDVVPRPTVAGPDDEGGRGLNLVEHLAHAWGVELGGASKDVWFELRA